MLQKQSISIPLVNRGTLLELESQNKIGKRGAVLVYVLTL